jgi:hypothetical protein
LSAYIYHPILQTYITTFRLYKQTASEYKIINFETSYKFMSQILFQLNTFVQQLAPLENNLFFSHQFFLTPPTPIAMEIYTLIAIELIFMTM